jgi:hypothetical protein
LGEGSETLSKDGTIGEKSASIQAPIVELARQNRKIFRFLLRNDYQLTVYLQIASRNADCAGVFPRPISLWPSRRVD